MEKNDKTTGTVTGIIANLVVVDVNGPVGQNEICYILHNQERLMAEVIKITEKQAYVQVFENTRGLKPGSKVEFEGHMLEVTLGPGMLSRNYDGLQNDLDKMEGVFLKRGEYTDPLDREKKWHFIPLASEGDEVIAGDWLGEVEENGMPHRIMVPFKLQGSYIVKSVAKEGDYTVDDEIAVIESTNGESISVNMVQKWPVKIPIKTYKEKPRPFKLLETGVRCIDTLNPITEGGTGFIPGPFGTGKTVLQHAISKQAEADIVIMAACGERANEVVEIFKEFPELDDPRTGKKLIERTIIVANTSNMPVAAREASVYTAMTLGEYYRTMGLKVLLMADSTSRWAQALREMSNRMEELPGPDAFPMDLSAIISNFYSRAGFVRLNNGKTGSITFIGTVSPAGGNLKEPVTENTRKAARCFYGLSQDRADSKRYPAIDPIDSYSKYLEYPELQETLSKTLGEQWLSNVLKAKDVLLRGREANEQINILGDDGVPIDFHERFWKAELIDFVILQQDAFDQIDASTPLERQKYMLEKVLSIVDAQFNFNHFEEVGNFFKRVINQLKQMNYSEFKSEQFNNFEKELDDILNEFSIEAEETQQATA
ncbi:V-type ATP synthase subunit A [Thermophagus xiamenensis]|uniref:V-type ATP synthase alpha chain n=1 Tax=Thermophagus xiamenensis TaxID=385682 RepID=A0A1I1XAX6_9BACT|nr:V-type ATP synthase subunit A [Thermophagus xiamenensis]SFE02883.1 V/A-type H+-transporting ATPase subunit A [Thermophagus xiamenensis]